MSGTKHNSVVVLCRAHLIKMNHFRVFSGPTARRKKRVHQERAYKMLYEIEYDFFEKPYLVSTSMEHAQGSVKSY